MQDARQQGTGTFDGKSPDAVAIFRAIDAHIGRRAASFETLDEAAPSIARHAPNRALALSERQAARAARSLWLDIVTKDESYLFELSVQNERAVVVGSFQRADVRIADARVEPVELHFEREGDAVCVVPAYGATVEVNAVRLCRPRRIVDRAIVEFQGHVLRVRVLDDPRWCSDVTSCDSSPAPHAPGGRPKSAEADDSEVTLTRLAPRAPVPPPTEHPPLAPEPLSPASVPPNVAAALVPRLACRSTPSLRLVGVAVAFALLLGFLLGQLSRVLLH